VTDQAAFEYEVFISYSHKDEDWVVNTLLPRVEQTGLKVCIDFRDFKPGKPSLFNMQHAVRHSRHTLLVLTPNWLGSQWTLFESILSATKDPAGLQQRTIPVRLQDCEMPENADFIAALSYVDFTHADREAIAWRQLLTALGRPPEPEPPKELARGEWFLAHPYPMPPNFTGRVAERQMLTDWLDKDTAHPLLVLRALGGFGKSALVWHWLTHEVKDEQWPCVVWWSFYEGDASFDHFLAETLNYLSCGKIDATKTSANDAVKTLLQILTRPGVLLVLDGFERELRAFSGLNAAYQGDEAAKSETNERDCISPLAELFLYNVALQPRLRSKVLLTTRLCPHVLEAKGGGFLQGCREQELWQMQPADAVEFFHAQGIRGTRTEIEAACEPYGYHPLSLRLLAGLIVADFQQPGDIAAAKRLDVSGDLIQRQHHVLETAYNSLTPERRALLGRIACFRSPVGYEALKALAVAEGDGDSASPVADSPSGHLAVSALDADLRDLVSRGLLHHDTKEGRFDLHPIVRRYAYDRLATPDRAAAHTRLRDYFAAVPKPDKVTRLEDLAPAIELYHHTVRAGQFDEARTLFRDRLHPAAYYQLGAYQLIIDLLRAVFPDGDDHPPRLKDETAQAWTLNALANSYGLSGQPRRAVPLWKQQTAIRQKQGDKGKRGIATGLQAAASVALLPIGNLRAAEANLRRSIALSREIKDEFKQAICRRELAWLLACRGVYPESETELTMATKMFEKQDRVQSQCVACAYHSMRKLLLLRSGSQLAIGNPQSGIPLARRTLELAQQREREIGRPNARDYILAHWLLGAAHRVAGQFDEAEHHLHEALERCRRINMVDHEANILIDLARLRAATGQPDEAQRLASEALLITERSGYVLQGADTRLELAKLAIGRNDKPTALEHATEANAWRHAMGRRITRTRSRTTRPVLF
jgi:tetratricopeptide (TPR) repeat protein